MPRAGYRMAMTDSNSSDRRPDPADKDQPAEGGDLPEAGSGAERASDRRSDPAAGSAAARDGRAPGTDTPTGTDPDAKYEQPGYEDKSFGQAVNQDQELVDDLVDAAEGDLEEAEQRFDEESAGSPTLHRQRDA